MTKPKIIYNPATIAECGGPCEQGPEYCDCGTLRINCPDASMDDHPLTDEMCDQIVSSTPPLPRDHQDRVLSYDGRILDGMFEECFEEQKHEMRAAYDLAIDQCEDAVRAAYDLAIAHFSKWIYENGAEYFIQHHEHNIKTDLDTIVADFRKSMRPQQQQEEDNFS